MVNPASDAATEQFGPYEVYERLGMGGMATVHRAKKRGPAGFERSVALKRMLSHLAEDPSFVESFVREAKVASLLQHPNIAQVYDFGRIGGVYYIAMELVAGFDLRKLLRFANHANEAIPLPVILSILGELCDALDYAHTFVDEAGQPLHIVHRDVSPSNLIVAHTGHLKVIDFGIAKAHGRSLHTESGQVKGKLGYMSPEVALGMPVEPVADIFSLGVVAWELVTASPLFSARTDFETMRRIREEPVQPPSRLNPACPDSLDRLILSALERDCERRLASARLFRRALDAIAVETGVRMSARSVSEWLVQFTHPADTWARAATVTAAPPSDGSSIPPLPFARVRPPTGQPLPPVATEPPTALLRTPRAPGQALQRSPEHVQLANEIWGEDVRTIEGAATGVGDFVHHVAEPGPASQRALPLPAPVTTSQRAAPVPAPVSTSQPSAPVPAPMMTSHSRASSQGPTPAPSTRKTLVVIGALVVVAIALGSVLAWKRAATGPTPGTLRFEVAPAGARVMIAGKELGGTPPLETQLAPGVYTVAVELDGYVSWSSTITVRGGERQTLHIALDELDREVAVAPPVPERDSPSPEVGQTADRSPVDPSEPPRPEVIDLEDDDVPDKGARPTSRASTKREPKRAAKERDQDARVVESTKDKDADDAREEEAPPDPSKTVVKVEPPKVEPPKPEPAKVEPAKPARTPVVAATAVTKLSGDVPVLRARNPDAGGNVLAKMCIDETGKVSSVTIVQSNPELVGELKAALASWRYKPYLRDGKPSPVCFPLSLRVVVKSG